MSITIQRGRQFMGDAAGPVALFEADGKLGPYVKLMAEAMVSQEASVRLVDGRGQALLLKTTDDWANFLAQHLPDAEASKKLGATFGVTFTGLVNVMDDVASGTERGVILDLARESALSVSLKLTSEKDEYAIGLAKGQEIDLQGPVVIKATAAGTKAIGPDILANGIANDWQRDRAEQESWADFRTGNNAQRIFRDNTGPAPFEKLTEPSWSDPATVELASAFNMPIHLESRMEGGTRRYQDRSEMFRETYVTDLDGVLDALKASVRVRVRFDKVDPPANAPADAPDEYENRRVLVQAKEGREIDPVTGGSVVHKTEERWGGDKKESEAMDACLTGRDGTKVLGVMQKLYQLAKDNDLLPPDGMLRLQPKHVVLQKRRRTHLQLDSVSTVVARRDKAKAELDAAGANAPAGQVAWVAKLDAQIAKMQEAEALLRKYDQYMPSGECFIVSADRYNVYDPAARSKHPFELDEQEGKIGNGLHVEAEWDTASSDPFEKARENIAAKLKTNPPNAAELTADADAIESIRKLFRADVDKTVSILRDRLVAAGMRLDPEKKSKEERATIMMASRTDTPFYWLS